LYQDFASHFSDITHQFAEDFVVYHDDLEVKASEWAQKLGQASTTTTRLELRRSEASKYCKWKSLVWSNRSQRFRWKWVPVSKAVAERTQLARRSTFVRDLGSVDRELRSKLDKPFRKFVRRLRLYQNGKHRPHKDMANDGADNSHENVQTSVSGPSEDVSIGVGWLDPEIAGNSKDETNDSEPDSEHVDSSDSPGNDRHERSQGSGLIYVLPKAATQARALTYLDIPFTEQGCEFAVAGGLDEPQLFDVMQMTLKLYNLEGLKKMTCECLLRTPTTGFDYLHQESGAPDLTGVEECGPPSSSQSNRTIANMFDEDALNDVCPSMTRDNFHDKLRTWMAAPLPNTSDDPGRVVGISSPDSNPWGLRHLLGFAFLQHTNVETGENMTIAPSRFEFFERFLDGLWLVLNTSKHAECSGELQTAEEKLPAAILALVTSLHRSMERAEELPYHVFYYSISQSFTRLFGIINRIHAHAHTIETIIEIGQSAASHTGYIITMKHINTALLIATKVLTELEGQTDVLEAEKLRRKPSTTSPPRTADESTDYRHVEEYCNKMFEVRKEAHRQQRFQQGIDHLENLGWVGDAARTILLNECRRRRVAHHADLAARMLETSFDAALTRDPSRKIHWKAAALPTDLFALLATRILQRPVLDGQDALNMYMRYVTDLVSPFSMAMARLLH
jgi:hypothetical protein